MSRDSRGTRHVFVSAVTREFEHHRKLLVDDLNGFSHVKVHEQRDFLRGGGTLLEKLDEVIHDCDAVIHLVGAQLGETLKPDEARWLRDTYPDFLGRFPFLSDDLNAVAPALSYTQMEMWLALYHRRDQRPYCHPYLPAALHAEGPPDGAQRRHWERLRSIGKDRGYFEDPQHLCRLVLQDLHDLWARDPVVVPSSSEQGRPSIATDWPDSRIRTFADRILTSPRFAGLDAFSLQLKVLQYGRRTSILDLIRTHTRVAIHGSPGSGKTVFFLRTLRTLARALLDDLEQNDGRRCQIPIYVELGLADPQIRPLAELLRHRLGEEEGDIVNALSRLLERCDVVLLLDGLNEVTTDRQSLLKDLLETVTRIEQAGHAQGFRVVITSRTYGLSPEIEALSRAGFRAVEVAPLDARQIVAELATGVGISRNEAKHLFQTLNQQDRLLLVTPQHLDQVIRSCVAAKQRGEPLTVDIKTRGKLLDGYIKSRLTSLSDENQGASIRLLRALAYSQRLTLFMPRLEVLKEAEASNVRDPTQLVERLFDLGLLVTAEYDNCRFDHHAYHQYFIAREMLERWEAQDEFVENEAWHESLVIMAGLLTRPKLLALLKRLRRNQTLHAYVLANVSEPDLARDFLVTVVQRFIDDTHRLSRRRARWLTLLAVAWFLALPVFAIALPLIPSPGLRAAVATLALCHVIAGLPLLLRRHQRQSAQTIARLRAVRLPELVVMDRFFRDRGPLEMVREELDELAWVLVHERRYDTNDERVRFVTDALRTVRESLTTSSLQSEDELLEQIADPLSAARIDPATISEEGISALCEQARSGSDTTTKQSAARVLAKIYPVRPEHRDAIAEALRDALRAPELPRRVKQGILQTCARLGIRIEAPVRSSITGQLLGALGRAWRRAATSLRSLLRRSGR